MRRPRRRRQRLLTVGWLVDEDQVLDVVEALRLAGFSVSVSPTAY